MNGIFHAVNNRIIKTEQKMAYLFLVRETVPFHCSEGDLSEKVC